MCLEIESADFCLATPACGWCEASLKCFPGNKDYAACPVACTNGWVYGVRSLT